MIKEEILINALAALNSKGTSSVPLNGYRSLRVYAEWAGGVTAGVVTVRHRRSPGLGAEDLGTLTFSAGKANSLVVTGPVGQLEAEITTAVSGGASPSVTVAYLAEAN